MRLIKPPEPITITPSIPTLFLCGSIEMGAAERWQDQVVDMLSDLPLPILILNPRRDDWDGTWAQSIRNPQFRKQVEWELWGMQVATHIIIYFSPGTRSPVTLLELGLWANTSKPVCVCCPEGYERKGNVDVVCEHFGVPLVETMGEMVDWARKKVMRDRAHPWWRRRNEA